MSDQSHDMAEHTEESIVSIRNISKVYDLYDRPQDRLKQMLFGRFGKNYRKEFWALRDVSFNLRRGDTLGIIGRNGSGKSTLLQIIAGILQPACGEVRVNGRVAALLELGSGFDPEYTGRENILINGAILGIPLNEMRQRQEDIIAFADIGEFIDQPVKLYSSGMFVRLAFAIATTVDADVLLIDEALAVGDVFFRQKCYARLDKLRLSGAAILLVSHSMGDIEQHCDRAILLDHGQVIRNGSAAEAIKEYYLLEQSGRLLGTTVDLDVTSAQNYQAAQLQFPEKASLPLAGVSQVNALEARCLRVALTDENGQPRRSFRFGETAIFHHEHCFGNHIGIPVGGVILHTEKGVILHGKNSLQARMAVEPLASRNAIVRFEHRVALCIAPGEYTFDIGMSSVSTETLAMLERLTHEEIDELKIRLVQVPRVGSFTMLASCPGESRLVPFYGLIDLSTDIRVSVSNDSAKSPLTGRPKL